MFKTQVLFVFYQSENLANGGTNSLWQIIESCSNVKPILVTNRYTYVVEKAKDKNVKVYVLPDYDHLIFGRLLTIVWWSVKIMGILFRNKIKWVHVNDIWALTNVGVCSWLFGKKLLFNLRGVLPPRKKYGFKWVLVNLCNKIVVLSEEMAATLKVRLPLGDGKRKHIKVIYSIVNFRRFQPVGFERGENDKTKLEGFSNMENIVIAAAFSPLKNQKSFIEHVIPLVLNSHHRVRFHFVGDFNPESDKYARECLRLVEILEITNYVYFHGYQSNIDAIYKNSKLTVITSTREGLARCMIESLASGVPVVSYNVCSAHEILRGKYPCGEVIEQNDFKGMSEAILRILDHKEMRKEYAENAVITSHNLFCSNIIADAYETIYQN